MSTSKNSVEVSILLAGNYLKISPAKEVLMAIADALTYDRLKYNVQLGSMKTQTVRVKLYKVEDGSVITYAGYLSDICRIIKERGNPIRFVECTPTRLSRPSLDSLPELRPGQGVLLAHLISSKRLIVQSPCASGKTFVMCQLCNIYDGANILIATPGVDAVHSLYSRLLEVRGQVGMLGAGKREVLPCTVTTFKSLPKAAEFDWDIVIVDEVHQAGSDTAFSALSGMSVSKLVGLSASPFGRRDGTDARVKALFGGVGVEITYKKAVAWGLITPLKYTFYNVDYDYVGYTGDSFVAKQRHKIWRNFARNRIIADACREWESRGQILVLVKTLEHAVHLGRLLPDYTLVYASMPSSKLSSFKRAKLLPDDYLPLTPRDRDNARKDFESGKLQRVISTHTWKQAVDFPQLQVIVRADGDSDAIIDAQIPGRAQRLTDSKDYAVIVDFWDSFDSVLCRKSQSRRRNYREIGFEHLDHEKTKPATT